jgi:hypothetical protein
MSQGISAFLRIRRSDTRWSTKLIEPILCPHILRPPEPNCYVEHESGDKEYHDRATDPDELPNTYSSLPDDRKASLHALITALQSCHDTQSCAAADRSGRSTAQR